MAKLRKIVAMRMPDVVAGGAGTKPPTFERAFPGDLLVDETYQRSISDRGVRLIRKIVADWNWATFMPPVVVKTAAGMLVIDGQHTAIAAATHPKITAIPVMVVEADAVADQAKAFLGRNRDRITVTPCQLYIAAVAAGDSHACVVDRVCRSAGVQILPQSPGMEYFKVGDTMAVSTVSMLVKRRGAGNARNVLGVLSAAKLAPISAAMLKAVDELMHGERHLDTITSAALVAVITRLGQKADLDARKFSAHHGVPAWSALVGVLLKAHKAAT